MEAHAEVHEKPHPTPGTYSKVAASLIILTALEVAVYYVESIRSYLIPILMVLMVVKFSLVAMYYMHLKQDSKLFSGVFVFPIIIAVCLVLALIALFSVVHTLMPS